MIYTVYVDSSGESFTNEYRQLGNTVQNQLNAIRAEIAHYEQLIALNPNLRSQYQPLIHSLWVRHQQIASSTGGSVGATLPGRTVDSGQKRLVVLQGQVASANTLLTGAVSPQIASILRNARFDVIGVNTVNNITTIQLNAFTNYSPEEVRQSATRTLNSATTAGLRVFRLVDLRVVTNYQTTSNDISNYGDNSFANSNGDNSFIDSIGKAFGDFGFGAGLSTPIVLALGLGFVLLLKR